MTVVARCASCPLAGELIQIRYTQIQPFSAAFLAHFGQTDIGISRPGQALQPESCNDQGSYFCVFLRCR